MTGDQVPALPLMGSETPPWALPLDSAPSVRQGAELEILWLLPTIPFGGSEEAPLL